MRLDLFIIVGTRHFADLYGDKLNLFYEIRFLTDLITLSKFRLNLYFCFLDNKLNLDTFQRSKEEIGDYFKLP